MMGALKSQTVGVNVNYMTGYIMIADCYNPYRNLAIEEYLFEYVAQNNCLIIYIWQNDRTVVIGRHQNAYVECDLDYAKLKKINIVRRKTGGGAVYQDLGNINFTVITPKNFYDINRSNQLILKVMQKLGILADTNGRNDICLKTTGEKISGNAYRSKNNVGMHHGTILFNTNLDEMDKVLSVSPAKLTKRGITSVRSRVTNLSVHYPSLTISMIQEKIIREFVTEYHLQNLLPLKISSADIAPYLKTYCNDDWNIKLFSDYNIRVQNQFEWGSVAIGLTMERDYPSSLFIETDLIEIEDITATEKSINMELAKGNVNLMEIFYRNVSNYIKSQVIAEDLKFLFNSANLGGNVNVR